MNQNKTPGKILKTLTVGHLIALDMAPLFVGIESGVFEERGLDIKATPFTDPYKNSQALYDGDIDICINPFTVPYLDREKDRTVQTIAAAGGWGIIEVVAQSDLGITDMAELKQALRRDKKSIKVGTLKGDTLELILKRAFVKAGISLDEVEIIYMDDLVDMVDAFKSRQVDILTHIKPYTTDMVKNHGAVTLTDSRDTWTTRTPNTVVSILEERFLDQPDLIAAYLNGLQAAAQIINEAPDRAVKLLSGKDYFKVSDQTLLAAFKSAPEPISFEPDVSVMSGVASDMIDMGYIKKDALIDNVVQIAIQDWNIKHSTGWSEKEMPHQKRQPFWQPIAFGFLSLILFFLAWEYAGHNPEWKIQSIIPPPSQFLKTISDSNFTIGLGAQAVPVTQAIFSTFFRVFTGIGIAFVLAIITGSLFSLSRIVTWMASPLLHLFAPIAPIAWIPLAILLFGIGNTTAIFVVFMGVYFILTIATLAEIKRIPQPLLQTAENLGATPVKKWIHVIFPAILPGVFTSLRINFIAAWMAVLAAEMVGLRDGIGSIIMMGRNLFNSDLILFGMVLIAMSGFVTDWLLNLIGKRFLWWKMS